MHGDARHKFGKVEFHGSWQWLILGLVQIYFFDNASTEYELENENQLHLIEQVSELFLFDHELFDVFMGKAQDGKWEEAFV